MIVLTSNPVIVVKNGVSESVSNARGGGGRRGGGGGFHRGGGRGFRGGFHRGGGGMFWNGAYWVDPQGLCYTKNLLGQMVLVNCGTVPNVVLGI